MPFSNAFWIAGLLLIHAASHAFEPVDPIVPPHYEPPSRNAEGGIWMVMDKMEAHLAKSPLRITDPVLETYLQEISCRLAPDYCDDIRIYVLRTPHFTASLAPNGMMQIWTGLLLRVRNVWPSVCLRFRKR